jgi:hypothetical protein
MLFAERTKDFALAQAALSQISGEEAVIHCPCQAWAEKCNNANQHQLLFSCYPLACQSLYSVVTRTDRPPLAAPNGANRSLAPPFCRDTGLTFGIIRSEIHQDADPSDSLLRAGGCRSDHRAADKRDEIASSHSITSKGWILRPQPLAGPGLPGGLHYARPAGRAPGDCQTVGT